MGTEYVQNDQSKKFPLLYNFKENLGQDWDIIVPEYKTFEEITLAYIDNLELHESKQLLTDINTILEYSDEELKDWTPDGMPNHISDATTIRQWYELIKNNLEKRVKLSS